MLSKSVEICKYEDQKPVFEYKKNRERPSIGLAVNNIVVLDEPKEQLKACDVVHCKLIHR